MIPDCKVDATHIGSDRKTYCPEHASIVKMSTVIVAKMYDLTDNPESKPCQFDASPEPVDSPSPGADVPRDEPVIAPDTNE